jgi:hypothetical protein
MFLNDSSCQRVKTPKRIRQTWSLPSGTYIFVIESRQIHNKRFINFEGNKPDTKQWSGKALSEKLRVRFKNRKSAGSRESGEIF